MSETKRYPRIILEQIKKPRLQDRSLGFFWDVGA